MPTVTTAAERIAALCEWATAAAPEPHREQLAQLRSQLTEPLRVAVAGRVKAGKSTFVNALLGQRIARTDACECTRVVTWFRYGTSTRVWVVPRAGARYRVELDRDGLIPEDLRLPVDQIGSVEVELSLARLRGFSLADTPGLNSPSAGVSDVTEEMLGIDGDSKTAISKAEAVLFVLNQTVHQSDVDVLRAFNALSRETSNDVISAFAVLNKSDLLGSTAPMANAARIADRFSRELKAELGGVFAYSGLFAELARCGILTEDDAASIEQLAAMDSAKRERMLLSESTFCRTPAEVTTEQRRRLWGLLREAGLRDVLTAVDGGMAGATQLRAHLLDLSGHCAVDERIGELFEANAVALKASVSLERLNAIAWSAGGEWGAQVRDHVESLRLDPQLHVVAEIAALRQVRRGDVVLPAELAAELAELVATPLTSRAVSEADLRRWQIHANSGVAPGEAQVARVVVRSYELASQRERS